MCSMEVLKKAGLTDGESKVYLALIKLGESTIGSILEESQVTKSIIYRILERLIEKGLVSYVIKGEFKHYQAAPPNQLLDYIDSQKGKLDETRKDLVKALPELLLRRSSQKLNQATIYEGFKGIMTVYEKRFEKLKEGDEYLNLGLPAIQPEHYHAFWEKDHVIRAKKKIRAKLLYDVDVSDDVLINRNGYKYCDARRMPLDIQTPAWILIYNDTVVIAIPQGIQPLAIEIVNKEVADSFRKYFNWFWENSKPFKAKK
jgi:HTH-type transcriptional regulator, sugar sensing transcriptional regulator